jgi:hypothetical protein
MKPTKTLAVALLLTAAAPAQEAQAWGSTGHRSVALIAEQHMSTAALHKAHALLDGQSLPAASMWADEIRSEPQTYRHTFNWHYTTWDDEDAHFHAGQETNNTGFLLSQLDAQLALLKNPKTDRVKRQQALRFVVHLLGDLHQPLHVGGGNDRGGNACRVTWHGDNSNLHTVWDSDMIDQTKLSYTELANFASLSRSRQQVSDWQKGTMRDWSLESKQLRSRIYPPEVRAPLTPTTFLTYCGKDVAPEAMPKLGYEYSYQFMPAVYDRLFQAGIRLAKVLDETL